MIEILYNVICVLSMKDLSIIVPTKDEQTAPAIVAELFKTFGKDTEVIVVDKSSEENKKPLLKSGATVLTQTTRGYENALMEGFLAANGKVLATIDADGTYDVSDLKRVIDELMAQDECQFVSGNRFGKMEQDAMTKSIAFGNNMLTGLFNFLYHRTMHDVLSGSFAMTREAFDTMSDEGPYRAGTIFFEIELARRGYGLKDIPVHYSARQGSVPQISRAKPIYGLTMAFHAIRYARDYNPILLFGSIGILLILAGLGVGIAVILSFLHSGTFNEVGRALISFMLLIAGFLSVMVGLILDLLVEVERKLYRKGIK